MISLVGAVDATDVLDVPDDVDAMLAAARRFSRAADDVRESVDRANATWGQVPTVAQLTTTSTVLAPLMQPAVVRARALADAGTQLLDVVTSAATELSRLHDDRAWLITQIVAFHDGAPQAARTWATRQALTGGAAEVWSWREVPDLVTHDAGLRAQVETHNTAVHDALTRTAGRIEAIGAPAPTLTPTSGTVTTTGNDDPDAGHHHWWDDAWDTTKDVADDAWHTTEDVAAEAGNITLSTLNAMGNHPADTLALAAGMLLVDAGAGAEVGGVALDVTGVGALIGVPANVAGGALIGAGALLMVPASGDLAQHAATDDRVERFDTDHREPNPKYKGRDTKGKYMKEGNDASRDLSAEKEEEGLKIYEKRSGLTAIRDKVLARVSGSKQPGRYYDGLAKKPDGTYEGVEIKSGGAKRTAGQVDFDGQVSPSNPATVTLPDGTVVKITSVDVITVP